MVMRLVVGILLGITLTLEALFLAGAGHGTYAPWIFAASLAALVPILNLFAAVVLWGLYFLLIPNLERVPSKLGALLIVAIAHLLPGCLLAYEDPAFARASLVTLSVFFATLLGAFILLVAFSLKQKESSAGAAADLD